MPGYSSQRPDLCISLHIIIVSNLTSSDALRAIKYQFLQLFLTISVCSSDFTGLVIAQEEYTRYKNVTLCKSAGIFIYSCSFQQ
jgi:hypothetical protein